MLKRQQPSIRFLLSNCGVALRECCGNALDEVKGFKSGSDDERLKGVSSLLYPV
jgi:hypothetical protein